MNFFAASALRSSFVAAAAAVVSLFAAAPVQAQSGAAPAVLTQVSAGSFRERLANPGQPRLAVQVVQNSNGQVLFAQSTTAPAYGHRLDFGTLPTGSYAVVLQVGSTRTSYNILVNNNLQGALSVVCQPTAPAANAALVAAGY